MDTSKKYIEMCKKVPKELRDSLGDNVNYAEQGFCTQHRCAIQYGPDGDYDCPGFLEYYHRLPMNKQMDDDSGEGFGSKYDCRWNKEWIPLYRQDQLQEMSSCTMPMILTHFMNYIVDNHYERPIGKNGRYTCRDWTMEQLWLAFVMMRKYQKVWSTTKKEWVK